MICRIADLIAEVPASGGLAPRCADYLYNSENSADVVIRTDFYRRERYSPNSPEDLIAYMESAYQFYRELLRHDGLYLHSSAVEYQGKAYLFSGNPGAGKSTHTRLWQSIFGEEACVFNDDKPALRYLDGTWYAYGTPWCGKDGINQNRKVPLAGICFLVQANENKIRRLTPQEAMKRIFGQTIFRFLDPELLTLMVGHVDCLLKNIPVYELENLPEPDAARLSYETMRRGAEELGL